VRSFHTGRQPGRSASGRIYAFAKPSGNGRSLRIPAVCRAVVARGYSSCAGPSTSARSATCFDRGAGPSTEARSCRKRLAFAPTHVGSSSTPVATPAAGWTNSFPSPLPTLDWLASGEGETERSIRMTLALLSSSRPRSKDACHAATARAPRRYADGLAGPMADARPRGAHRRIMIDQSFDPLSLAFIDRSANLSKLWKRKLTA
jgi:hypothetical protein